MRRRQVATALSCFCFWFAPWRTFALHLFQLSAATLGRHVHVTCQALEHFSHPPPRLSDTDPPLLSSSAHIECQPFRQYLLTLQGCPFHTGDSDSDSDSGTAADQEEHQSKSVSFIKFDGLCWLQTHGFSADEKKKPNTDSTNIKLTRKFYVIKPSRYVGLKLEVRSFLHFPFQETP